MGQPRRVIWLNTGIRSDVMWCAMILEEWNGVNIRTNASGSFGCGAWNPVDSAGVDRGGQTDKHRGSGWRDCMKEFDTPLCMGIITNYNGLLEFQCSINL